MPSFLTDKMVVSPGRAQNPRRLNRRGTCFLTLYRAGGNTLDDVLLAGQVEGDNRDDAQ